MNASVSTGTTIPLEVMPLINKWTGALVTGATNVKAKIRRQSDNLILDWSDMNFKTAGLVTQLLQPLTEVDEINFAGEYLYNLNPATIVNYVSNDSYSITVIEDGSSDISNLPQAGCVEISLAQDEAILARKLLDNKHTLEEGHAANMVIYDNDKATVIREYNVTDKNGNPILIAANVPTNKEPV